MAARGNGEKITSMSIRGMVEERHEKEKKTEKEKKETKDHRDRAARIKPSCRNSGKGHL